VFYDLRYWSSVNAGSGLRLPGGRWNTLRSTIWSMGPQIKIFRLRYRILLTFLFRKTCDLIFRN